MRFILIVLIFFVVGCNNHQDSNNQLELLQNIFPTSNWQVTRGSDTSFVFFSPQADNNFKTYEYNLFKGDSANTEMGSIRANNGKVEWDIFNKAIVLDDIKNKESSWKDSTGANYILTRQSDSVMQMKTPNGDIQFKKTLPLSTFLVRAKYDYEHGSKLLDSGEIKPRKLIRY